MRPKRIFLLRHGESVANIDREIYFKLHGHKIPLTQKGKEQAIQCAIQLREKLTSNHLIFYLSPYLRTKQTFECIVQGLTGIEYEVREEPRIREQDFGNPRDQFIDLTTDPDYVKGGPFFYRFVNGESGADVYDRVTSFFSTLHRDFLRQDYPDNVVIVTHGMLMRLFLMRWFHWTVGEFEELDNPPNCHITTMILQENGKYRLESALPSIPSPGYH